ncbi:MAG: tetratricopeptide repeat protein [Flavitalea sp.]
MKKQPLILITGATALFCIVFFFGRTVPARKSTATTTPGQPNKEVVFNVEKVLQASKAQLTPEQQSHVTKLESAVVRGNVKDQQASVYKQLAAYYKDSAHLLLPFAYYTGEAAKLENSEKSLTFAARFFLESVRSQQDPGLKRWMADESRQLFEKALVLDPANDSLKIGLGSCYLFGNISETPMQGILMIREVSQRDPNNMYAQFMLGMGGMISGQLDKAIERLTLVASKEPNNVEAKLMLAEAYEKKSDKPNAAKWYEAVKLLINNPDVVKEIDARIELLKK